MNLASVRAGDIVRADVRGDQFYALAVEDAADGHLPIESLTRRPIPSHRLTARQVVAHWRKSKQSKV